jgi:[ribosomal protein S5]-alanine N-acetyltransferase
MKSRIRLARPGAKHQEAFLAEVRRSRSLHKPWVAPPSSSSAYKRYVKRFSTKQDQGFLVMNRSDGSLVGVINLGHITRGLLQSAYLGYYGFSGGTGKGLMQEGLQAVLAHVFRKLKLHRVEANIQPGHKRSIRLARRLGFRREGYSRRYLKVRGRWEDHERWALLAEDWKNGSRNAPVTPIRQRTVLRHS